ncbi:hypothetical protein QQ045_030683 [Rhodiola kirilowii]
MAARPIGEPYDSRLRHSPVTSHLPLAWHFPNHPLSSPLRLDSRAHIFDRFAPLSDLVHEEDDAVNMFLGSYTMDQMGLIEAAVIAAITVKFNHKVQELNMIPQLNEAGQMAGDDVAHIFDGFAPLSDLVHEEDDAVNMFLGSYTMDQMGLIEAAVIAAITVKFNHKVQELNMIPHLNEAGQMAGDDVHSVVGGN